MLQLPTTRFFTPTWRAISAVFVTVAILSTAPQELCESGWMLKGELCYKLTTEELTWSEAQEKCRSMNSLLAEVESTREQDSLNDFLSSKGQPVWAAWIGLSDQQMKRRWTWGSGRSMNYSNWANYEPNNMDGTEYCVNVWPRELSHWNDHPCNASFPGVCQKGYCATGWIPTRKACYQLTEEASRSAAQDRCLSMGGSLAEIKNVYEQDELKDFLTSQGANATLLWIGLTDAHKNRVWKWDSGSDLKYERWIADEPNNSGGDEYCVNVWQQYNFDWNDDACYYNYSGVCKQNKGCPVSSELCRTLSKRDLCTNGLFKDYMNSQCSRSCGRCS